MKTGWNLRMFYPMRKFNCLRPALHLADVDDLVILHIRQRRSNECLVCREDAHALRRLQPPRALCRLPMHLSQADPSQTGHLRLLGDGHRNLLAESKSLFHSK